MIIKELRDGAIEVAKILEWRFVAEQDGEILAQIIYGAFEDQPEAINIYRFMVSETAEHRDIVGANLLKESMGLLQQKGINFKTLEFHLYSGKNDDFAQYAAIFKAVGFQITQEKKSLEVLASQCSLGPIRTTFKTLEAVGEAKFIDAIQRVTEGTLDRDDLACVGTHGPLKAAMDYFTLLKDMDFDEKWWRLAYGDQEELIGLVVPQRFNEEGGVINYIGVVPSHRGKGYVGDLISEACRIMLDAGLQTVVADIDQQNQPLEKALLHHGFRETRELAILKYFVNNKIQEGYNKEAETYARTFFDELDYKPLDRYLFQVFVDRLRTGAMVCDMGCGPGHVTRFLKDFGVDVFGMDISEQMLAVAREKSLDIEFVYGDMLDLKLKKASLGGVVLFYAIVHFTIDVIQQLANELWDILEPGGLVFLAFHAGDEVMHVDSLLDHEVDMDYVFLNADLVGAAFRDAGFELIESLVRQPVAGHEYPSKRGYIICEKRAK